MKAGLLDRRVTIQRPTYTINEFNEHVPGWAHFITVWASKTDVSDRERIGAQQVQAQITTRFQIRWSSRIATVSPTDRLIYENRIYEIFACKELGRRDGIEITAAARAEYINIDEASGEATIPSGFGGSGQALGVGTMIIAATGTASGSGSG